MKIDTLKPVVKWAGGKRQLATEILQRFPNEYDLYVEPFVGGAAILLSAQPTRARINDYNKELINVYTVIKENPMDLLNELEKHDEKNSSLGKEWFYHVRGLDRTPEFDALTNVERAARILYLNKTCFNGLFRVNASGQFNVPYGRYKHPNIVNTEGIMALNSYLNHNDIQITCGDYTLVLEDLPEKSFVYLDPPYMPLSNTSSFTGYIEGGFGYDEQKRLRDACVALHDNGIKFLQSNSDCEAIRELYSDFKIETIEAKRTINSRVDKRGSINEVLISG